ncbi:hypothetical protein BG011_005357 [Mortierella polycephala]|uniref:Eisosome component PIL1-domain-containing protein n=1 Tax=Mortierella polycephala TaxID=41804 RepID=A0A9P6QGR4_9FUNG|nr:hypothetical protein BG011_005357 [Mortierella polycephala]
MQSIGHDLRRGINNINPLGNNYKTINKWLAEMKNIDSTLKTLDKEISADAKLIAAWGATEGDDLTDVCQRMSQLMEEVGLIQQAFSLRHTAYRKTIKSIKTQEMTLDENRKKKHDLTNQITKHQKSNKDNPIKMMELQNSLERVTVELLAQELDLMQFKRVTMKEAFDAKFDAMLEYAEKMALIAGYGRAITYVIDTETQIADRMRIYNGGEYTASAVTQVKDAVTNWQPQPMNAPPRAHVPLTQDELALSAAAAAYNSKTPPMGNSYAAISPSDKLTSGHGDAASAQMMDPTQSSMQEKVTSEQNYGSPPTSTHAQQLNHIQEQQRQLELEQQRLHQQNLASYTPERSPSQQHYQNAANVNGGSSNGAGGYTSTMPQNETQELYPPTLPPYDNNGATHSPSSGHSGYQPQQQPPQQQQPQPPQQHQYSHYDTATYQSTTNGPPARNYRLGFVDPRERSHMDQTETYKVDYNPNARPSLPPLQFPNSPILDEK